MMPHVAFVPLTGFRVREADLLALGMSLPGLQGRAAAIGELPALGLLTLAGMLPEHWTCSYRGTSHGDDEFAEHILAERPTLVAISALTASVDEAYRFSRRMRAAGVPTVIGGLHVSVCPDEARRHCDAVVVGEGEPVWLQVLADAEQGRLQPIYHARDVPAARSWPLPRFDLLDPNRPPRFTLQTQRGCPLACDFCAASRLLGKFHEKPAARIQEELAAIGKLSAHPLIELADDNTFAGSRDVDELFDALKSAGVRYFTEADWRIGERADVLARLAESGCVQVLTGLESLVFRYPGMGAKHSQWQQIMDAVVAVQDAGVAVNGCFILGADGETRDSMDRLVEFILDSPLAEVQVTLQTPFPGTALHQRLHREGRLLPDRGWPYYTLFDVTYQPDRLSVAELEQGFRDVLGAVFSKEASQRREGIRRNIWRRNPRFRDS
jgi:radical SAM superfamily enzyme YgiQ (UPF0313 family)